MLAAPEGGTLCSVSQPVPLMAVGLTDATLTSSVLSSSTSVWSVECIEVIELNEGNGRTGWLVCGGWAAASTLLSPWTLPRKPAASETESIDSLFLVFIPSRLRQSAAEELLRPCSTSKAACAANTSAFLGRPRFFLPVAGSIGLLPRGMGLPFSSTTRRLGGGRLPSARGLGGRPRRFRPVKGSKRMSTERSLLSLLSMVLNSEFIFTLGDPSRKLVSLRSAKTTSFSSSSLISPLRKSRNFLRAE